MATTTKNAVVSFVFLFSLLVLSPVAARNTTLGKISQPLTEVNGQHTLNININGQEIDLVLRPTLVVGGNTRVVNLSGYPQNTGLQAFQGFVQGEMDSWVRLAIHENTLSGVISRQGNRYQLDGSATGLVNIKPLSENTLSAKNTHSLQSHAPELRQDLRTGKRSYGSTPVQNEVTHFVDIAIIVDSQYNKLHGGNGLQKALSIINSVDGVYREEFGLALRVVTALNVTDLSNDPFDFGNVAIETMLRGLRDFRMRSPQFDDASLVHLFTGNQNSDAPVGLAWIDTACRNDGYDVGLSTPYRHEILLAAHEIAHNLGALHDTDTACRVENDKVMWPYISSQTSQNFSSCTRTSVQRALQNSCHAKTIDLQVSQFANDDDTNIATVRNNYAEQSSTSSTLTIDLPAHIATALSNPSNYESTADSPSATASLKMSGVSTLQPVIRNKLVGGGSTAWLLIVFGFTAYCVRRVYKGII